MKKEITVFAPATVGNLACGFDCMGLAIERPGDTIHLTKNTRNKLYISEVTGDDGKLSHDIRKNTASVAIAALLKSVGSRQGFDIRIHKQMPLGSGLGSSAASAAAGVYAASVMLNLKLKRHDLIPYAMEGERAASGAAHADNVAPSLMGGITLVRSNDPLEVISLPVPDKLYIVVVHPDMILLTRDSRAVLRQEVPLKSAVQQWANTASLVSALYNHDYPLIGRCTKDHIAEPARKKLIPGFDAVQTAALAAGAIACSISGSGPSLFAFCKGKKTATQAALVMKAAFHTVKLSTTAYISPVNTAGAVVIS